MDSGKGSGSGVRNDPSAQTHKRPSRAEQWIRMFRLEMKLLYSNWFLLIMPVLFGVWLANNLMKIAPPVSQNIYMFAYEFHKIQHTLSLGAAMLLGILLIRRDMRRSAYEWTATLNVPVGMPITAKFIVGLLYMSLYTAAMFIVFVICALSRQLPGEAVIGDAVFFALQYEWSYAVTLALAMFLAAVIPNRIVYMIGFCAWVFGTFFIDQFIITRFHMYYLKVFHLSQFMIDSFYTNELWGQVVSVRETWLARLFVAVFIVLLLVLMNAVLGGARPNSKYKRSVALAVIAVLVAAGAYAPYGLMWKERYEAYADRWNDTPNAYEGADGGESQQQLTRFAVNAYNIHLKRLENDALNIDVIVDFPAYSKKTAELQDDWVTFTLNRSFEVRRVQLNGNDIVYDRTGDFIRFPHSFLGSPGQEQSLEVQYEGKLFEWIYDDTRELALSFVRGGAAFLPEQAAWYPVAGNKRLYVRNDKTLSQVNRFEMLGTVRFTVTVEGFPRKVYGTITESSPDQSGLSRIGKQTFTEEQASGVTLYAGDFLEVRAPSHADPLTMVTSASNKLEAEHFMDEVVETKKYYESWLDPKPDTLRMIYYFSMDPFNSFNRWRYLDQQSTSGTSFTIGETLSHNLDDFQRENTVNVMLFGDMNGNMTFVDAEKQERRSIVAEIRNAIRFLYYRDALQMTMEQISHNSETMIKQIVTKERSGPGKQMITMIDQAVSEGNADRVKQVLNAFAKSGLKIEKGQDYGYEYPIITMEQWKQQWSKVMGNDGT